MMLGSEILTFYHDFFINNQEIIDYCKESFGLTQTVQMGVDFDNLPQKDLMPCIIVHEIPRTDRSQVDDRDIFHLYITVVISNSDKEIIERTENNAGSIIYNGLFQCEEFREFIETQFLENKIDDCLIDISGETRQESSFPIFRSEFVAQLSFRRDLT